ncbi:unnamed protein product [Ostreobium quekettii]|uniref:Secreted protein n=1 Tax=Ostreobium quekettii TaxID=121088 RepID=A0A8S1IQ68_9CHLO|nr:unnamed protein product [Ostreobium quekettii]
MKPFLVAAVLMCTVAWASAQDFPDDIGLCGEGVCMVTPVIKDDQGDAIGVGPVSATVAQDTPGGYPAVIALCGRGRCITVPVMAEGMTQDEAVEAEGVAAAGDWPDSIGLCGQGQCMVTPVNKNDAGVGISVGPVPSDNLGAAGDYPEFVGLCGRGVCAALPVVSS